MADDQDEFPQGEDEPHHGLGEAPPQVGSERGASMTSPSPLPSPPLCPTGAPAFSLPDSRLFVGVILAAIIVCALLWGYIERDVTHEERSAPTSEPNPSSSDYYGADEQKEEPSPPSAPMRTEPPASDYYGPQ